MRRAAFAATVAALALLGSAAAQAQESFHVNGPLRLNVRPRNWLEPGNTVAPYSSVNPASAYGQTVSYLRAPPYGNFKDQYGEGVLPDPVQNGPFIGARNPFGPVDYGQAFWFR